MSFQPPAQPPGQPAAGQPAPYQTQPAQPHHVGAPAQPQPAAVAYQPQPVRPSLPTTLAHTNTFALVSILTVFLQPIAGIVFGHIGLSQIKRNGDAGRGIALTGLILGYAYFAMLVVFIGLYVSMIGIMIASMGAAFGDFGGYDSYGYDSW